MTLYQWAYYYLDWSGPLWILAVWVFAILLACAASAYVLHDIGRELDENPSPWEERHRD